MCDVHTIDCYVSMLYNKPRRTHYTKIQAETWTTHLKYFCGYFYFASKDVIFAKQSIKLLQISSNHNCFSHKILV